MMGEEMKSWTSTTEEGPCMIILGERFLFLFQTELFLGRTSFCGQRQPTLLNAHLVSQSKVWICGTKLKEREKWKMRVEQTFSNDDREKRDLVSMGWRGMPSFSTMGSIVCTQLAVARQAGPPAEGLFHPLRSNRMWQPIWTGEMSQAPKKKNWDNCPFQKNSETSSDHERLGTKSQEPVAQLQC